MYIKQMRKMEVVLIWTIMTTAILCARAPLCPVQSKYGSLVSARVTVAAQQSLVTLSSGIDSQCYYHPLPYDFSSVPQVAIAIHDFESRASNDLFFSIKNIQSDSVTSIPFLIRTQWRYTTWNKIVFSFIAEDRSDFQSGYFQVDSGALGGCEAAKNIQVILPFRAFTEDNIKYAIFLTGFQISSQKFNSQLMSPFQVQLADSSANSTGIIILITVTTVTQVHSLHISYTAWLPTTQLQIISGTFIFDPTTNPTSILAHSPPQIGRNYARLHGITGFIINQFSQNISLSTIWTGSRFLFQFGINQKYVKYFSFSYLFFIGSECANCPGYQFFNNGVCATGCPVGAFPTAEKTCVYCGEGNYWDGTGCIKMCPVGQTLNPTTNKCQCPNGTYWTGSICINCTLGRIFNYKTSLCECPPGNRWNGFSCAKVETCTNGRQWNVFSFRCECPAGSSWNGTYCIRRKICTGGTYYNNNTNQCQCPDGTYLKNGVCQSTGCIGGQTWNGTACSCEAGLNWNGSVCLLCINGQIWNQTAKACYCEANYEWNGNFCDKKIVCSGGRVWNKDFLVCMCPDGQLWSGNACIVKEPCCCGKFWNQTSLQCDCPDGFYFDGKLCVFCTNGKKWDPSLKTCVCPSGSMWNGNFCAVTQKCLGGSIWNQNTWTCECPITTVWNNNVCIFNPCKGGQIWDNLIKVCVCPGKKILSNGICVIPETTCINGQIWDTKLYICTCPTDQWFNGTYCVSVPKCINNQIYNPFNNKCQCHPNLVFLPTKQICGDPTCPPNKRWDGQSCVDLTCPPNSYYNGSVCICPNLNERCLPWEIYDGYKCVYYQSTCPKGTKWNGTACVSNSGECPDGYYKDEGCKPLSQKCLPTTIWNNNKCVPTKGCPFGTVGRADSCQPYTSCQGGQVWDPNLIQCICPKGTGWSGKQCIVCGGGQIWSIEDGCTCPEGMFMNGATCQKPTIERCKNIPNAYYDATRNICLCYAGFSVIGFQCICRGVPMQNFCDRCAHRPNSQYYHGICKCNSGYTLIGSQCLPNTNNGNNVPTDCSVSTFFDTQQKKCLACPAGCLTCTDCYTCQVCNSGFILDIQFSVCVEKCGDGLRFISQCDDGNLINGDGCTNDCKIQPGWICKGGSPISADSCSNGPLEYLDFEILGQIRYTTKIIININVNYIPQQLVQSSDCNDRCSGVLKADVIRGEKPTSVRSLYIPGSRFTFSVELEFSKPWMSGFALTVQINPSLKNRYFPETTLSSFTRQINPATLRAVKQTDTLA